MAKNKDAATKKASPPVPRAITSPLAWEHDLDRWFDDLRRHLGAPMHLGERRWWPFAGATADLGAVDVYDKDGAIVVKVDLPGIDKQDLDVTLSDHRLTVRAHKKHEENVEQEHFYRSERSFGTISRTVELPAAVEADKAHASFKNGVLEIRLPRADDGKGAPRKLAVD